MNEEAAAKKQTVVAFYSRAAPVYNESPSFHVAGRRLVEVSGVSRGDSVLDIATGRGAVLFPAVERIGVSGRAVGIDIAGPMVEATAAEITRRDLTNAKVLQMDAENLEFPDSTFDHVLAGFVLNFIPDLASALAEIRRVLRPGGRFAASTWRTHGEQRMYIELAKAYGYEPLDLNSQTLSDASKLETVMQDAGFTGVKVMDEEQALVFESEEQWWAQRPGNQRVMVEHLEPESLERFKKDALAMIQEFNQGDVIRTVNSVNYVLATSP